jgi:DNA-binding PadR family transcriptional regulator
MGSLSDEPQGQYYQLTAAGRRQLKAETENWGRISVAITSALRPVERT